MKSTKASFRSFKNLVSKSHANKSLAPNKNYGETVIPIGPDDLFVELPRLSETSTFNIINTDKMTGAITLKTSKGASLKGLILNNVGGTLNIEPIPQGATSFEMGSDVKDGCFVETISNGSEWFIWSVATHGSLGIGHVGGNSGTPQISTGTVTQTPAAVQVTITSETTFPAPSLEARHQLTIRGKGEPGTTIQVTEQGGAIQPITGIIVDSSGDWGPLTIPELLESGTYHFDFIDESPSNPGAPVVAEEFADDTGALIFTTPNNFTVEQGQTFDFTAGASATDPSGNPIAVNTNANDYSIGLAHNATFDIVYSFTHNGTPYTRTVSGVVKDTIAPAKPTITSANFPSNINDFVATGNAEDGSTVEIFFDNVSQGTVTSIGGTWTFTSTFVFLSTFDITVQATDAAGNHSDVSLPTTVQYNPPTLTRPTLVIVNAPTNTWTNQDNPIELTGTTDAGSTIIIKSGNQTITPHSGPNYVGGTWDATINVADESNSSLTVVASKANFNSRGPSLTKTLLVDRVDPVINNNQPLGDLTAYLGNLGINNDVLPATVDQTSGLNGPVLSDWATQVTATQGAKTVTYTATDLAGNSATASRTVNVTTQVIVPTNLVATGGEQQATITGDVSGTYAENLFVKIYVTDSNGLEEVYQENGVDKEFAISNGTFSAAVSLSPDNYTFEASTVNSVGDESDQSQSSISIVVTAPAVQHLEEGTDDSQESGSLFRLLGNAAIRSDGLLEIDGSTSSYAEHYYSTSTVADYVIPNDESKTVSVWFYARTLDSGGGMVDGSIVASSNKEPNGNTPQNGGFSISVSGGRVRGKTPRANGLGDLNLTGTTINTNEWYKVDLVWRADGTAGAGEYYNELWLNGSLVANHASQAGITAGSNLKIGWGYWNLGAGSNGEGNPFDGFIDRLIIREEALSASDILANYNSELSIVSALDVTPPTITLNGNATESFTEGENYTDAGVDLSQNAITPTLVTVITNDSTGAVVNALDANTAVGNYTIRYTATDSSGNSAFVERSVAVNAAVVFVEDIQSVIDRANGTPTTTGQAGVNITNGIVNDNRDSPASHGLSVRLADDGIIAYDPATGETVNDEFTISFWANLDNQNHNTYFMGTNAGRRLYFYLSGTNNPTFRLGWNDGTSDFEHFNSNAGNFTNWTHFALVVKETSTNIELFVYINGSKFTINQSQTADLGTKIFPPLANQVFKFGGVQGISGQTKSVTGQFDSIQFGDGIALSDDQILWISQDSLRQRTIDGAMAAVDTPPTISLQGASNLFHVLGQTFTDPGATAIDQLDGNLTPTTSIVNSLGQTVSSIDSNTPADTYTITYTATDSALQSATVTRTVTVSPLGLSASLLNDSNVTVSLFGTAALSNGILTLDGASANNYATIPGSSNYDPATSDLTYSAWFKADNPFDRQMGILSNITSATNWNGFAMQIIAQGTTLPQNQGGTLTTDIIRVAPNNSNGTEPRLDTQPLDSSGNGISITEGVWNHLAVTFNSSTNECIAYYNGVEAGSVASGGIFHDNNEPFFIGRQFDSSNLTFRGQIQGVRIEQTLKGESELLAIYNAGPQ